MKKYIVYGLYKEDYDEVKDGGDIEKHAHKFFVTYFMAYSKAEAEIKYYEKYLYDKIFAIFRYE